MNKLGKIIAINLGVLLGYSLLFRLIFGNETLSLMLCSAFVIFIHFFGNLVMGLSRRTDEQEELGNAYILSSVVVLVIGFGVCLGNANIR